MQIRHVCVCGNNSGTGCSVIRMITLPLPLLMPPTHTHIQLSSLAISQEIKTPDNG